MTLVGVSLKAYFGYRQTVAWSHRVAAMAPDHGVQLFVLPTFPMLTAAVHLLPRWGAFSDSLPDGGVDALSWAAVLLEIGGALAFGVAGAYALRRGTPFSGLLHAKVDQPCDFAAQVLAVDDAVDESIGDESCLTILRLLAITTPEQRARVNVYPTSPIDSGALADEC